MFFLSVIYSDICAVLICADMMPVLHNTYTKKPTSQFAYKIQSNHSYYGNIQRNIDYLRCFVFIIFCGLLNKRHAVFQLFHNRLRHIIDLLECDSIINKHDLIKNLKYSISVLDTLYIEETK